MGDCKDGHDLRIIRDWTGGIVAKCDIKGCKKTLGIMQVNAILNEHASPGVISKFGDYNIPELLRAIASDYKNPKAADSVRNARCMWLNDLADFIAKQGLT